MKRIDFYFNPAVAESWRVFNGLPEVLAGQSVVVEMRPVLLAELTPPPEGADAPALLQLALACAPAGGTPGRVVVERLLRHVWHGAGADPNDAQALVQLTATLAPRRDPADAAVRAELQAELQAISAAAVAAGVRHLPTLRCDGRAFAGAGAPQALQAWLQGGG